MRFFFYVFNKIGFAQKSLSCELSGDVVLLVRAFPACVMPQVSFPALQNRCVAVHFCDACTWWVETQRPKIQGHSHLSSKFEASLICMGLCLKERKKNSLNEGNEFLVIYFIFISRMAVHLMI